MQEAIKIIKTLQNNGFYALLVGGCVRDSFMGLKPKDFDIVTNCLPEQIEELFKNTLPIGAQFGVTLINNNYEVSCFRADIYNPNEFSVELLCSEKHTLEELIEKDSSRRDFTLNSIYYDPISDKYYDPQEGIKDIKNRKLRFVGSIGDRIKEDPLRMLRFYRFKHKYNLDVAQMDCTMWQTNHLLEKISKERIFEETTKILLNFDSWNVDDFISFSLCLESIFPWIKEMRETRQSPIYHPEGEVLPHTFYALKNLRIKTPVTVWAIFLHDIGKIKDTKIQEDGRITSKGHAKTGAIMSEEILRSLKCSNKFIEEVVYIVENHMKIKETPIMKKSKVIRLVKNKYFDNLKEVSCADSMGGKGSINWYYWLTEFENSDKCPKGDIIEPLVKGKDLIDLGLTPGPIFNIILKTAFDVQLENPELGKQDILNQLDKADW